MCSVCEIDNKMGEHPLHLFTDEEIDAVILGIYAGVINTSSLDYETYKRVAEKLTDGVFEGYGKRLSEVHYATEDYYMLRDLRENVYIFSAAKDYQMTREISALLTNEKEVNSFADFRKLAKEKFLEYNEDYLRAEYNSAISQARTASQWQQIQSDKHILPMLTYHTVGDGRVRPTHEALNNISRPVDDKFWDKYMPPNGWNCRCTVLQNNEEKKTSLKDFKEPDDVPDIFQFNAGKERIIFSPKHPYFDVAAKDKTLARNNFNLPLP